MFLLYHAQPFTPAWSLNIVLVDGEALHRRLGGRMLRKLGCSYTLCEGIYDVRRAIHESDRPFDLVLTDIVLARGSDGRQLCAQLREDGYNNPIVACTGVWTMHTVGGGGHRAAQVAQCRWRLLSSPRPKCPALAL